MMVKGGSIMMVLNQFPAVFRNGSLESQIDRLLDDAIGSVNGGSRPWTPACNVFEDAQGLTVQIAIPGWEANQIKVEVVNNELHVTGERPAESAEQRTWLVRNLPEGSFSWSCRLPASVDTTHSTASYAQGLLTLHFPTRDEAKPRQISITCQ
jgi:HSP20 family protein